MSSQIGDSVSTSLMQGLQTIEQARTSSSLEHLMTAAAGWIRRGLEFAQSHPEITPIVLAAPTVIIATRTALSYFSTATDPTEEEDQELPEEVFEELSMAADALEEPIVNPTRAPAAALIEELDGVLNSALQEQQIGSDREEDRPSPSADLTRTATASPLRVEAGRYIAILCKEGQKSPFEQGENCTICQDDAPEDIVGHPIPSSRGTEHHKFHKVCITQWNRTREYSSYFTNELGETVEVPVPVGSRGCPLCKEPIVSIEGQEAEVAPAPTLTSLNEDLRSAARDGRLEVVQALISAGADLNAPNREGRTALHLAAENGHFEVINVLIAAGVDLNTSDPNGWTALQFAAEKGHVEVINVLIAAGADLNASDPIGWTALQLAADRQHVEVIQALIDAGVDLNASDPNGWTTLHLAALNGHVEVINVLISAGADLHPRNRNGSTALHVAASNGYLDVINALIDAGTNLSVTDGHGWTALHAAAENGHLEVVQALTAALEAERATQTEQDSVEKSTLQLEAESEYFDVGSALRTAGAII